jgi:hypothetical protein
MGRLAGGATSFIGSSLGLGGLASMARLGPYGMLAGAGIMAGRPIGKGFAERAEEYPEFMEAMGVVSGALKKFGAMLADEIMPRLGVVAEWLGLVKGKPSPYGAITAAEQAAFDERMATVKASKTPKAVTTRNRDMEKQTEYLRQMNDTLFSLERDISKSELFDPW